MKLTVCLQVKEAEFKGFSKLEKIDLTIIHSSTDSSFTGLDYSGRLATLAAQTTTDRLSDDYIFKDIILKNAPYDITIKAGKTMTASKVGINESSHSDYTATC